RDILRSIGARKRRGQIVVGFALETSALVERARAKLIEKGCDLIVANSALEPGVGMGADTNRITLVDVDSEIPLPLMSKRECAAAIFDAVERKLNGLPTNETVDTIRT